MTLPLDQYPQLNKQNSLPSQLEPCTSGISISDENGSGESDEGKWMSITRNNLMWFRRFIKGNIENFVKSAHHTDCFSFPDEYSFFTEKLKIDEKPRSQILILDKAYEEIMCYLSFYELFYHNTDNFTEDHECIESKLLKQTIAGAAMKLFMKVKCRREHLILRYAAHKDSLIFPETIVMLSTAGEEVGEITVNVERAYLNKTTCMKVEINNNGVINGIPCGSNTVGYISSTLDTVFMKQCEYIITKKKKIIKQTQMRINKDKLFEVKHIMTTNNVTERKLLYFSSVDLENFISNASSILIQRLIIKAGRQEENFIFDYFDEECHLCTLTYEQTDVCKRLINDNVIEVIGLTKCLKSPDFSTQEVIYFDKNGLLISQTHSDIPIILKSEEIIKMKDKENRMKIKSKKELDWRKDAELSSQYLLKKEKFFSEYQTYMEIKPDISTLVHDFVQALLVRKPTDVLAYAAYYFSAFSPKLEQEQLNSIRSRRRGHATNISPADDENYF